MRWTTMATEHTMQFNLIPENEHERRLLKALSDHKGSVTLTNGVSVDECRGGYLRNFGEQMDTLAITVKALQEKPADSGIF